jgi:hypothetical protein
MMADGHILFNTETHVLSCDEDGSAGGGAVGQLTLD